MNPLAEELKQRLRGEVYFDHASRVLYATDASVYRALPAAVVLPKDKADIQQLVHYAGRYRQSLIPRAAGTSLAGQCVGNGIVVDCSKYMNQILELNVEESWVKVQPGVIRDELNNYLKPFGLFFGPNTSTSNRCMIGGMVGNNSCGSTSIVYGSTRDHVLELEVILSDGTAATFKACSPKTFFEKCEGNTLEAQLYRHMHQLLMQPDAKEAIQTHFPKPAVKRRNTGYALDQLLDSNLFAGAEDFNFCELLAGSEGTLAFTTAIKLNLSPLPPKEDVVLAAHFNSVDAALRATVLAMDHNPSACELMDKVVLDCTKANREQQKNRFFVEGDPKAVLCLEFRGNAIDEAMGKAQEMIAILQDAALGYAFPIVEAPRSKSVWALRKAGLGLLANLPGEAKAVACIEDTAVAVEDLPDYIREFEALLEQFGQQAVYYAHAGAGELHLRPILNLKDAKDRKDFRAISEATANLVRKYKGSLSGEHGDGRVRAEFIPLVLGEKNYELFRQVKNAWDPLQLFNPGKITDAPPMDEELRYKAGQESRDFETIFDFSKTGGFLNTAEKCNGSGDCRKLPEAGGTMCPSYQATRNERETTRGRANLLREMLTRHADNDHPFYQPAVKAALDLCISCKGCTSECPSNVDMASLKAEFLYQYYKKKGMPLRSRLFARNAIFNQWLQPFAGLYNGLTRTSMVKKIMDIAPQRSIPKLHKQSLRDWYKRNYSKIKPKQPKGGVTLFVDAFTQFLDVELGAKAIRLICRLGYEVSILAHPESGRAAISKGDLKYARWVAEKNVSIFEPIASKEKPLIGIEPSAILSFRDEYPRLVSKNLRDQAEKLSKNCLTIDEWLAAELQAGNIDETLFIENQQKILLHGHCHQKALSDVDHSRQILEIPKNFEVEITPSGCCGMAGSFGYEKEHYEVSMKIGALVLFPAIQKTETSVIVAAPGTSCRHQIFDGTQREALHPIEILWNALKD